MKSKISLKRSLIILGIGGVVFSIVVIFSVINLPSVTYIQGAASIEQVSLPAGQVGLPAVQAGSGLPIRLKIPKINADAIVEYVGLTSEGAMAVPKGPENVAWFNLGPRPGESGSAVIAGHEGWKNGIQAVFDNLNKLRKGDKIYVEDEKGATVTFVVRESRTYGENDDASDVFGLSDGKAHLNLVTCEGVWDKIKKSYSKRLVVFTDKVDSTGSFDNAQDKSP